MSSIPATLTFSRALVVVVVLVLMARVVIVQSLVGGEPRLSAKRRARCARIRRPPPQDIVMNDPRQLLQSLDLEAFWMPLTSNRAFKQAPRLVVGAKDMYYTGADGRQVMDAMATLWCVNAGHCRPRIVEAIARQAGTLDYCSSYSIGHPVAFEAAHRVVQIAPEGMKHVFFVNSGSESVDTALKISLAYHRLRGAATRTRFIGRERGFHGANIGGMSVGGVPAYRKAFGAALLPHVDHLRHTQDLATRAFVHGQSDTGAALAEELEHRIIPLHDAINIAAVIVEPVAGAGGVLVPPQGYLERLREICDRHGILLIFDEVITGFGRLGRRSRASSSASCPT